MTSTVLLASGLFAGEYVDYRQEGRERTIKALKPQWRACSQDQECDAFEAGCYFWVPVNKPYKKQAGKEMKESKCLRGISEGPKPEVACVEHKCSIKKISKLQPLAPGRSI